MNEVLPEECWADMQNPLVAHLESGEVATLPVAGDARAG